MKRLAHRLLRATDRDVVRYSTSTWPRRVHILNLAGVDVVLDVGAHIGEYATRLRHAGFRGRIVSFEPQPAQFEELRRLTADDPGWECHNIALGERDGTAELNVGT